MNVPLAQRVPPTESPGLRSSPARAIHALASFVSLMTRRWVLAAATLFAAFQFCTWAIGFHVRGDRHLVAGGALHLAGFETVAWAVVGLIAAACGWILPVGRRPTPGRVALLFAGAFAITVGRLAVNHVAAPTLGLQVPGFMLHLLFLFPTHLLIVTSYVGLGCGLRSVQRYYAETRELAKMSARLGATRLNALRNSLRPDLLLHALDRISAIVPGDAREADRLLVQFSDFLRHQLKRPSSHLTPLSEEIEFARQYVLLRNAGSPTPVELRIRSAPEPASARVPTGCISAVLDSLLQPGTIISDKAAISLALSLSDGPTRHLAVRVEVEGLDLEKALVPAGSETIARNPAQVRRISDRSVEFWYPLTQDSSPDSNSAGSAPDTGEDPFSAPGSTLPLRRQRRSVYPWFALYWCIITVMFLVQTLIGRYMSADVDLYRNVLAIFAYIVLWIMTSVIVFQLTRGRAAFNVRRMALAGLCACAVGILSHTVQTLTACGINGAATPADFQGCFRMTLFLLPSTVAISVNLLAVGLALHYMEFRSARAQNAAAIRAETTRAQMALLENQLRPHFLFNALQSAATLMHSDPQAASGMLMDLRALLSHSLTLSDSPEAGLEQELESVRLYLALQRRRFRDRLTVAYDIQPEALGASVPPYLLQPLVENAVHHAIAVRGEGHIHFSAFTSEDARSLRIDITDTGAGTSAPNHESHGIGVRLARSRLAHLYGPDASLDLSPASGGGTRVSITIPLRG